MGNNDDKRLNAKLEINNHKTKEPINLTKEKHIMDIATTSYNNEHAGVIITYILLG
jgi:hypothetical protein